MLIIISPAKKLDFENASPVSTFTQLNYLDKSQLLIDDLRKCLPAEISSMMKLSQSLTALNVDRYQAFNTPFTPDNSKQAMFAFKGDTYMGLDADTMTERQINYAQAHLRILSGLYGLVSPLDLIQPYRLEMGTRFSCCGAKDLYQFWSETLTTELSKQLKVEKVLVNLASKEYFSVIDFSKLQGKVVTPQFKQLKDGKYKIISFFAKRARGMMSRYIIDNQIESIDGLKGFDVDGYAYNAELSTESEPVFTRDT